MDHFFCINLPQTQLVNVFRPDCFILLRNHTLESSVSNIDLRHCTSVKNFATLQDNNDFAEGNRGCIAIYPTTGMFAVKIMSNDP